MFSHWWEESRDSGGPYTIQALYNAQVTLTICEKLLNITMENNGTKRATWSLTQAYLRWCYRGGFGRHVLYVHALFRWRMVMIYVCSSTPLRWTHMLAVCLHSSLMCPGFFEFHVLNLKDLWMRGRWVWDSGPVDSVILSLFNICAAAVCETDWASVQQLGSFSGNLLNRCWKEGCFLSADIKSWLFKNRLFFQLGQSLCPHTIQDLDSPSVGRWTAAYQRILRLLLIFSFLLCFSGV